MLRWMRRRCRCSRRVCALISIMSVVSVVCYIRHLIKADQCSEVMSRKMLQDLCSLYRAGDVAGSFCHKLCDTKDLQYSACTNYRAGKKVLFMQCKDCDDSGNVIPVVFKMKEMLEDRDKLDLHFINLDGSAKKQQSYNETVRMMVKNSYWFKFSKDVTDIWDILSYTWGWDFNKFVRGYEDGLDKAMVLASNSIWSLSEQHEYLMSKLLQKYSFMPKIYGTCGPAYFTEFTPTLGKYEYYLNIFSPSLSWDDRAHIAIQLIKLIQAVDSELHQLLNLCDVKPDNFGLRDNGEVTLIDTDCALFQTDLLTQFNNSKCSAHADCDFFDCNGYCDIKHGKCLRRRTNNNLQSLCKDVLMGQSVAIATGLLRDPPASIRGQLSEILYNCSYPDPNVGWDRVRTKTPPSIGQDLLQILQNSATPTSA